jgi:hypothetical protein
MREAPRVAIGVQQPGPVLLGGKHRGVIADDAGADRPELGLQPGVRHRPPA